MTDAHQPNEIDGPHEGPIKTPRQLVLAVLAAFVVPISAIVLLAVFVTTQSRPPAGSDALAAAATAERIQPIGRVEVKDLSDLASLKSGDQVFSAQCTACHTAGVLNAPKFGDAAAWAPRIKTGYEALVHSALAGKGAMPPQGGGDFADLEIARAVVYMTNKAGANFEEPKVAPAAANATTASAGPAAATTAAGANASAGTPGTNADAAATAASVAAALAQAAAPANAAQSVTVAAATGGQPPALFGQVCSACHAAGVAGAPRVGDKAAWAPRIAQGIDALTASAIKGKGAMPPKGGSSAADADIKTVVTYMANASK